MSSDLTMHFPLQLTAVISDTCQMRALTDVRLQRREGIRCDVGPRARYGSQHGALPGIREPQQPDVGQ